MESAWIKTEKPNFPRAFSLNPNAPLFIPHSEPAGNPEHMTFAEPIKSFSTTQIIAQEISAASQLQEEAIGTQEETQQNQTTNIEQNVRPYGNQSHGSRDKPRGRGYAGEPRGTHRHYRNSNPDYHFNGRSARNQEASLEDSGFQERGGFRRGNGNRGEYRGGRANYRDRRQYRTEENQEHVKVNNEKNHEVENWRSEKDRNNEVRQSYSYSNEHDKSCKPYNSRGGSKYPRGGPRNRGDHSENLRHSEQKERSPKISDCKSNEEANADKYHIMDEKSNDANIVEDKTEMNCETKNLEQVREDDKKTYNKPSGSDKTKERKNGQNKNTAKPTRYAPGIRESSRNSTDNGQNSLKNKNTGGSNRRSNMPKKPDDSGIGEDIPEGTTMMDVLRAKEVEMKFKLNKSEMESSADDGFDSTSNNDTIEERRSFEKVNDSRSMVGNKNYRDLRMEREGRNKRNIGRMSMADNKKFIDPRMEREKLRGGNSGGRREVIERSAFVKESYEPPQPLKDKEFDLWNRQWSDITEFKIVEEIQGNLFDQPKEYSLAHCVAEDLRMGMGIAVAFKRLFKCVPELLDQRAKEGGLAFLQENNRYIYYLVTKKESSGKPTYNTLWQSLCKMREHIKENKVKKLAIPTLGCGLDRLQWDMVKSMLEFIFKETGVEIRVCHFQPTEEDSKSKCRLVIQDIPVTKIDPGTLILYLATTQGNEDDIIRSMSKKFNFLQPFKAKQPKNVGDIIYFDDKAQNYGICACIVRETPKEPMSFRSLHECVREINKMNRKYKNDAFQYVAVQWVEEGAYFDEMVNEKVITVLINFLRDVDIYVCKGSFEELVPLPAKDNNTVCPDLVEIASQHFTSTSGKILEGSFHLRCGM